MPLPRVLMLPKWYPNRYDDQDGDFVARHVDAIARVADADGPARIAVVFAAVARGPLPRLIDVEVDLKGRVPTWRYYYRARLTGIGPVDRLLKLVLWTLCTWRGLRAVRRHWGGQWPEIVHAHVLLRTGAFALALKWLRGIPYLITENWTIFAPANVWKLGRFRQWLAGLLVRQAAAYTPVSDDLRRNLARLGGVNPRTVIVPNVVDTELFHLPAAGQRRRGLLNVAAFNEKAKNLSGLLRTVARLRTAHPHLNLHLRIAGYGAAEAQMHQLATDLGLLADGTVEFLGKLTSPQVAEEMRRAQAFVLFSNYENLPCVLIEAQASGLPAVATSVNGVPELLPPDGTRGLLVPPADEAALAQALLTVLQADTARFDPAVLRAAAEENFSYPAVGQRFAALYANIVRTPVPQSVVAR
ncbi:glycosyltransferase family 4 protein [Hymenobacter busanensis]|uniref:Glycosyltransferase family 4 protein n=1 Tax=Hymenobacter busanensis TaxID=2607656 RepID=A0A7L4ZY07_9BACT|nr:glycosyltransferase [Hymenobacter busanensis]KAA9325516.1 glycosyltransferase family 4 protein [Hymenobacter busanensis]QHJ07813.1 glycosyltransferase [Hymenobacter busanensis]